MDDEDHDSQSSLEDYNSLEATNASDNNNNNNNGLNVTIEEAVFKYVRGIELDNTKNIPDGYHKSDDTINNNDVIGDAGEIDGYQITSHGSLFSTYDWCFKSDKTCESSHPKSRDKRELDGTDKLSSLKRVKLPEEIRKDSTEENFGEQEQQINWINKELFIEDKESNLLSKNTLVSTTNSEYGVYQSNKNLLMGKRFQNILPKTEKIKGSGCFDNDQSKFSKSRELRKLVGGCLLKISQLNQNSNSYKDIKLEEDNIIKGFIEKYQEIYELSYDDIRYIIWNDYIDKGNVSNSEYTGTNNNNNEVDIRIIDLFWRSFYKIFPGRLHLTLNKRIRGFLKRSCKKGKWTKEEDELLYDMCTVRGLLGKWSNIGYLLNRTPEDCRNRWRDYGVCQGSQKKNQWTVKEEEQLFDIIVDLLKKSRRMEQEDQDILFDTDTLIHDKQLFKCAINWNQVSKCMGYTRSRIQCQYKWKKLLKRRMLKRISERMTNNDIRRIISIITNRWTKINEIDWYQLSDELGLKWHAKELELFFNVRLKVIPNYKQLTVKEICKEILKKLDN